MRKIKGLESKIKAVRVDLLDISVFEDDRQDYGEQRMIGIGLLESLIVLIVHVESETHIRIISMRKADSNETDLYYQNIGYF